MILACNTWPRIYTVSRNFQICSASEKDKGSIECGSRRRSWWWEGAVMWDPGTNHCWSPASTGNAQVRLTYGKRKKQPKTQYVQVIDKIRLLLLCIVWSRDQNILMHKLEWRLGRVVEGAFYTPISLPRRQGIRVLISFNTKKQVFMYRKMLQYLDR